MPRDLKSHENAKRARARRDSALARQELGYPTEPRTAPAGPTSMGIKVRSASDDLLIEAYLNSRNPHAKAGD